MDMPRRTNVPYATALTLAHTLLASVKLTKTFRSAATTLHVISFKLQSETPQKVEVHSNPRRTYVS